jgi:hypothetical protein
MSTQARGAPSPRMGHRTHGHLPVGLWMLHHDIQTFGTIVRHSRTQIESRAWHRLRTCATPPCLRYPSIVTDALPRSPREGTHSLFSHRRVLAHQGGDQGHAAPTRRSRPCLGPLRNRLPSPGGSSMRTRATHRLNRPPGHADSASWPSPGIPRCTAAAWFPRPAACSRCTGSADTRGGAPPAAGRPGPA